MLMDQESTVVATGLNTGICPGCGRCERCGRPRDARPSYPVPIVPAPYPVYPAWPTVPLPHWQTTNAPVMQNTSGFAQVASG